MYHIYEAFYNLHIRFRNLISYSTVSMKINLSFLSKSNFHHFDTEFITSHTNRINYLHLWTPFIIDLVFSSLEKYSKIRWT